MSSVSQPYLLAHQAWHRHGPPTLAWNELLTLHLHHGILINTPEVFACIMPVPSHWSDAQIFDIQNSTFNIQHPPSSSSIQHSTFNIQHSPPHPTPPPLPARRDLAMVWLAAGRWELLLTARSVLGPSLQGVAFTRRNSHRLRRYSFAHLARHGIPQNATTAAATAASAAAHP
jgi:hypothetical protein